MIMRIFHLPWDTIHGPMHNLTGRLENLTPVLDQVIGLSNVGGIISYETLTIRFFSHYRALAVDFNQWVEAPMIEMK